MSSDGNCLPCGPDNFHCLAVSVQHTSHVNSRCQGIYSYWLFLRLCLLLKQKNRKEALGQPSNRPSSDGSCLAAAVMQPSSSCPVLQLFIQQDSCRHRRWHIFLSGQYINPGTRQPHRLHKETFLWTIFACQKWHVMHCYGVAHVWVQKRGISLCT